MVQCQLLCFSKGYSSMALSVPFTICGDCAQLLGCVGKKGPAIYDLDPGYYSTHMVCTQELCLLCVISAIAQLPKKDVAVYDAYW